MLLTKETISHRADQIGRCYGRVQTWPKRRPRLLYGGTQHTVGIPDTTHSLHTLCPCTQCLLFVSSRLRSHTCALTYLHYQTHSRLRQHVLTLIRIALSVCIRMCTCVYVCVFVCEFVIVYVCVYVYVYVCAYAYLCLLSVFYVCVYFFCLYRCCLLM